MPHPVDTPAGTQTEPSDACELHAPQRYRCNADHSNSQTNNHVQGDPYELYKLQFDQRYSGNRAPLGIYLHAAWLIADPR